MRKLAGSSPVGRTIEDVSIAETSFIISHIRTNRALPGYSGPDLASTIQKGSLSQKNANGSGGQLYNNAFIF